jgi:undecaprenol kinase
MDIRKFIRSFGYAAEGLITALREQNIRFHYTSVVIVLIIGWLTGLSVLEWIILVLVMSLVVGAELFNTAIERIVDLASPEFHPLAKQAKDIAAGAVLVFALASVIIGMLIFFPKWF